jgi:uncharacterized damage-inducible protein DinB
MAGTIRIQDYLGGYVQGVINQTTRGLRDLDQEELHFRPGENCNSIAFDAWHIARTADNLVHFAFEREKPVWLQQGLDEKWGLPKVDQGTGMTPADAYALRFPEPSALIGYCNDVAAAIVPKIEQMSDEYLLTPTVIKPQGELPRYQIIGQVIVNHGNNHIGQINLALTLLGKPGLGI